MEEQKDFSLNDEELENVSGGAGAASCSVVCGQCGCVLATGVAYWQAMEITQQHYIATGHQDIRTDIL